MADLNACPVCLNTYEDPQLLPACGHTFCRKCLDGLLGVVPMAACPNCRAPFRAGEPKPNFALRQVLADTEAGKAPCIGGLAAAAPAAQAVLNRSISRLVPRSPVVGRAARLLTAGVPPGLARLMEEEDRQIGLRLFLLDNSGSTTACDGHYYTEEGDGQVRRVNCSRWEEIKWMAVEHAEWNAAAGVPCEFLLLNPGPPPAREGVDFVRVDTSAGSRTAAAQVRAVREMLENNGPRGATPLADRIEDLRQRIRHEYADLVRRGQRVVLVVVTDGLPTGAFSGSSLCSDKARLVKSLKILTMELPVYVVVRLVTDDREVVEYYNGVDTELELSLEVMDDFMNEAREIRSRGNTWLTYSPLMHKIREGGTFMKLFDLLDERRLNPVETGLFVQLLLRHDGEPPFPSDPARFMQVLRQRLRGAKHVYDPLRCRMVPPVDLDQVSSILMPLSQQVVRQLGELWEAVSSCGCAAPANQREFEQVVTQEARRQPSRRGMYGGA